LLQINAAVISALVDIAKRLPARPTCAGTCPVSVSICKLISSLLQERSGLDSLSAVLNQENSSING